MNQESEVIPQEEKQHLKSGMAWLHCSILLAMGWSSGCDSKTGELRNAGHRCLEKKKHLETGGSNLI